MVKITKAEAKYMRGAGYAQYVHHTYTNNPTLFLTEDPKAMRALKTYRESLVIERRTR